MDLIKLTRIELLDKCEKLGIKKYKSKNKVELIDLLTKEKHLKPLIKWSGGKSDEIKIFP